MLQRWLASLLALFLLVSASSAPVQAYTGGPLTVVAASQPYGCEWGQAGLSQACVIAPYWYPTGVDGGGLWQPTATVGQAIFINGGTPPYYVTWDTGADGTAPLFGNAPNNPVGAIQPTKITQSVNNPQATCPGCQFGYWFNDPAVCTSAYEACSNMYFNYALFPGTYYPYVQVEDQAGNVAEVSSWNAPYYGSGNTYADGYENVMPPVNVPADYLVNGLIGTVPTSLVQWQFYQWDYANSTWLSQYNEVPLAGNVAFNGWVSTNPPGLNNEQTCGVGPYEFYWNTGHQWMYNGMLTSPNYNGLYLNQLFYNYGNDAPNSWPIVGLEYPQLVVKNGCGQFISSEPTNDSLVSLNSTNAPGAGHPFSTPPYGSSTSVGPEANHTYSYTVPGVGTETIDVFQYGMIGPWLSLTKSGAIYASHPASIAMGTVKKPVYGKSSDFDLAHTLAFPTWPEQIDLITSGIAVNLPYYPNAAVGSKNMPQADAAVSYPTGPGLTPDGASIGATGCQPLPFSLALGGLSPNPYDTNANCMHDIFLQEANENNVSLQPWYGQGTVNGSAFDPGMEVGISTVEGPQVGWVEEFDVEIDKKDVTMNPSSLTEAPYLLDTYMYGPYYEPLLAYTPFVVVELGSSTMLGKSPGFSFSDLGASGWTIGGQDENGNQCDASVGTMLGINTAVGASLSPVYTSDIISGPYGMFQWTYYNVIDGLYIDQTTLPVVAGLTGMVAGNCYMEQLGAPIGSLGPDMPKNANLDAPAVQNGTLTLREQSFLHSISTDDRNKAIEAFSALWPQVAGPHPNLADKWAKAIPGLFIRTGVTAHDFTKPWELSVVANYDTTKTKLTASQIADQLDAAQVMRPLIVRGWSNDAHSVNVIPAPRAEGDNYTYREN